MSGKIWAESEWVRVQPFTSQYAGASLVKPYNSMISLHGKIATLENIQTNFFEYCWQCYAKMLNKLGYHADVVSNGEEVSKIKASRKVQYLKLALGLYVLTVHA